MAIANGLCISSEVTIVYYKGQLSSTFSNVNNIDRRIKVIKASRANVNSLGLSLADTQVISMCFTSDLATLIYFWRFKKNIFIRGNLFKNYWHDYNVFGLPLALLHYQLTRFYDKIFVLNMEEFYRMRKMFLRPFIVPNCLDETSHSRVLYENETEWDIIFVGNLNTRKRVHFIIKAVSEIKDRYGINLSTVIVGDGPEKTKLQAMASKLRVEHLVNFTGFQNNPESFLSRAKIFVLPSSSEGTSRAAMEALFYGNYCILSDIPASRGLVVDGETGSLYSNETDLAAKILAAYKRVASDGYKRQNFLPKKLRQASVIAALSETLNS